MSKDREELDYCRVMKADEIRAVAGRHKSQDEENIKKLGGVIRRATLDKDFRDGGRK